MCVCLYVSDVPFVNLCVVHDVRFFRACGMIAWCECVSGTVSYGHSAAVCVGES